MDRLVRGAVLEIRGAMRRQVQRSGIIMNHQVRARYQGEVARIRDLVAGPPSNATFLFDDLAAEAGYVCGAYAVPFCTALRAAVTAFQIAFVSSKDAAVAYVAACARLEVMALLADGR